MRSDKIYLVRSLLLAFLLVFSTFAQTPLFESRLIFPLEHWHNHSSSVIELPNGDLFVCWYNGSGERKADDVKIEGSLLKKGTTTWTPRTTLADTPRFPDANPILFLDKQQRVWLIWPVILANEWHTGLLSYKRTTPVANGKIEWREGGNILFQPADFKDRSQAALNALLPTLPDEKRKAWASTMIQRAEDKYFSRMGWMPRIHALQLKSGRILLPLYSDGYDYSLIAISDDNGNSWTTSYPLVSEGGVQPSLVQRKDGSLVAYMRDNGPAPQRVIVSESRDQGMTWSTPVDSNLPNPGASVEVIALQDGRWLMVNNDTERGRHSLVAALSDDEGKTWKWQRHIELDKRPTQAGSYHYPSVLQAKDGTIHVTYSYFLNHIPEGQPRKSIKHARFNTAWIEQGDPR